MDAEVQNLLKGPQYGNAKLMLIKVVLNGVVTRQK